MIDNKTATRVVLQVLPHMGAGGLVRGAIDSAAAQVGAGWVALVASEGGHGVRELERVGAHHFHLPLASKNPIVMYRNVRRLQRLITEHKIGTRQLLEPRSKTPALWPRWRGGPGWPPAGPGWSPAHPRLARPGSRGPRVDGKMSKPVFRAQKIQKKSKSQNFS